MFDISDYILHLTLEAPVEPPNARTVITPGVGRTGCTVYGDFGRTIAFDSVHDLGRAGAHIASARTWRIEVERPLDETPIAYRLVESHPRDSVSHRLRNPSSDFEENAPHPDRPTSSRLKPGVSPSIGRKPRGEFGFVHDVPIVHRTVARRLEEFGARVGQEIRVRDENSGWFTVELSNDPDVLDADLCSRLRPCSDHHRRDDVGVLVALPDAPHEFGWARDACGWGCDDYVYRTLVDEDAHDFLFPGGRKRAGHFAAIPVYPHDGEMAAFVRELSRLIDECLPSSKVET